MAERGREGRKVEGRCGAVKLLFIVLASAVPNLSPSLVEGGWTR